MKDIGILASIDPVAIDQACIDLVYNSNDEGKHHLIERITSRRDEPKKKESKIKAFYAKHKWAKPATIILALILLFIITMFGTIIFFNNSRPKQAEMPNVAGYNEQEALSKEAAIELSNIMKNIGKLANRETVCGE